MKKAGHEQAAPCGQVLQIKPTRQASSKGEEEAGNHREQAMPGEEALAIGMAAIIGWFENEVENTKDKDPAQRHGKLETRNGPGCQVCFLILVCPVWYASCTGF